MAGGTVCPTALGFLTATEHAVHGLIGGYLLLNATGRPLEFHCTAPLKPTRAQQILYGPTLEPYLYGEQIGSTLVKKSSITPLAVLVDGPQLLAVRQQIEVPVALVLPPKEIGRAVGERVAEEFQLGENWLRVSPRFTGDRQRIDNQLRQLPELFDLAEPFERIRGAIEEAQRGSKAA